MKVKSLSCVRLFVTPWTAAYQAPLSMGFFRQEYWSGLPFPPPRTLPNPGIEPLSMGFSRQEYGMGCHFLLQGIFLTQGSNLSFSHLLHSQGDSLPLSHLGSPQILRTTLKFYNTSKVRVLFLSLTSIFATIGKPTPRKSIA